MALNLSAFGKGTTTQTKPKTGLNLSAFGVKYEEPEKREPRIIDFPPSLGGGQFSPEATFKRSQEAIGPPKSGEERDHIFAVFTGGTSDIKNLEYKPTDERGRQAGKVDVELDAYNKWKKGEISIQQARVMIAMEQQRIQGLTPTEREQTTVGQLRAGIKETVLDIGAFFKGVFKKGAGVITKEIKADLEASPKERFIRNITMPARAVKKIGEFLEFTEDDFTSDEWAKLETAKQKGEVALAMSKYGDMVTMSKTGKMTGVDIIGGVGSLRRAGAKLLPKTVKPTKKIVSEIAEEIKPVLDNLNPTGNISVKYSPKERMTMKLGDNITTLDKTSKKAPDTMITIYRGAPKNQKVINPGDFITTNYNLAKDYAGTGNILKKEVKMSDILDDITEPLGEEYIYRPAKAVKEVAPTISEADAITKRFTTQERQAMEEFIDVSRGVKKVDKVKKLDIQETAQNIAESFKLPEVTATNKKLADKFESLLSDQASEFKKLLTDQRGQAQLPDFVARAGESVQHSLAPIKHQDKTVKTIFKRWTRSLLIGEQKANDLIKKIPKVNDNFKTILKYEAGEKTKYSSIIKKEFDTLFNKAKDLGLEVKYWKNYIPHVYDNTTQEIQNAMARFLKSKGVSEKLIDEYARGIKELPAEVSKRLKISQFFVKTRAFPDYATAIKFGLTPKYKEPAQLLSHYALELEKTVANKRFLDRLVKRGRLKQVKQAGSNWQAVNLPFSPKGYYAEPKLAKMLNGIFRNEEMLGTTERVIKFVAGVSKTMQEIVLSAGFPKTNLNFFALGMGLVKELTAGNLKAVANFIRANFNERTIKYFAKHKKSLMQMAEEGIDMSSTIASHKKIYTKIGDIKGLDKKLGFAWDKTFQEKTFNNLMPMNYLDTFRTTYDRALKKMPAQQAQKLAGDTVRAYHGLYENIGRGKGTEDALSALFFAPKFREGLILTLFNTAKSLTSELFNPAFRKNRQLAAGMALTFAGYNALNKKLSGHFMWENPPGKEFELMIPTEKGKDKDDIIYVPFMPSFLAFPRSMISGAIATAKGDVKTAIQKFGSLASMPVKLVAELWANKDYFGRDIYNESDDKKTIIKDMAGYVFGINKKGASGGINHPFIRETYNQIFTEKPLYQSISEALEIPLKFSTMTKIEQQEFYRALEETAKKRKQIKEKFRPTYDEIQNKMEAGKIEEAQIQLENLTEDEYKLYKSLQRADKTAENRKMEAKIFRQYEMIKNLRDTNEVEAQKILDNFTEEEYQAYKRLKNKLK